MKFDHEFQMVRAKEGYERGLFDFRFVKLLESGEFVTMVWDLHFTPATEEIGNRLRKDGAVVDDNGNMLMKGIEVFHVRDGKIVEVWVAQGWGLKGSWGPSMTCPDVGC